MTVIHAVPYVKVDDLEAGIALHRALGYEIRDEERDDNGRYWVQLMNGNSRLMLSNRLVHDRARLTWLFVEDADVAYDELVAEGLAPLGPVTEQDHGTREFLLENPAGDVYVISHHIR